MKDEETPKESIFLNNSKVWYLFGAIIFVSIVVYLVLSELVPNPTNNATLVVEVAVGLTIALFVYRTSKKTEKINQNILDEIRNIVKEGKSIKDSRISRFVETIDMYHGVISEFLSMMVDMDKIDAVSISLEGASRSFKTSLHNMRDVLTSTQTQKCQDVINHASGIRTGLDFHDDITYSMYMLNISLKLLETEFSLKQFHEQDDESF